MNLAIYRRLALYLAPLLLSSHALLLSITAQGQDPITASRPRLEPLLTCVTKIDENRLTAVFGYKNQSPNAVSMPIGEQNQFDKHLPKYSGQPTYFRPGVHPGVFSVDFENDDAAVWKLNGTTAIGRSTSPRCQLQCPPDQGETLDGQCIELASPENVLKEEDVMDAGPIFQRQADLEAYVIDKVLKFGLGHPVRPPDGGVVIENTNQSGAIFVPHEDGQLEIFDDKYALAIGGRAGKVNFRGTDICIRDTGCETSDPATSTPSPDPRQCAGPQQEQTDFCIFGDSFALHFLYNSVGGLTDQDVGGYHVIGHHFCLKAHFIPWSCPSFAGSNTLSVTVTFLNDIGNELCTDPTAHGSNTTEVRHKRSSWFHAPTCGGGGTASFIQDACSVHGGSGNSTSATAAPNRFVSGLKSSTSSKCGQPTLIP